MEDQQFLLAIGLCGHPGHHNNCMSSLASSWQDCAAVLTIDVGGYGKNGPLTEESAGVVAVQECTNKQHQMRATILVSSPVYSWPEKCSVSVISTDTTVLRNLKHHKYLLQYIISECILKRLGIMRNFIICSELYMLQSNTILVVLFIVILLNHN